MFLFLGQAHSTPSISLHSLEAAAKSISNNLLLLTQYQVTRNVPLSVYKL